MALSGVLGRAARWRAAGALLTMAVAAGVPAQAIAAPTNGDFAGAAAFHGWPVEVEASNVGATRELRQSGSVALRLLENGRLAQLVYRAAPGQENSPIVAVDWGPPGLAGGREPLPPPARYYVNDHQVSAGRGCTANFPVFCEIPSGALSTGPVLYLGDRRDIAHVEFSRARTKVFGGRGDDVIRSGGRVSGGPGDDEIRARAWVRSRIAGGRGKEMITGSLRDDIINPGPGMDTVFTHRRQHDGPFAHHGRDLIHARDGASDRVYCDDRSTVLIDAVDYWPEVCGRVERRGVARAVPETFDNFISEDFASASVACPPDVPHACVGSLTVSANGVTLRKAFRIKSKNEKTGTTGFLELFASKRKLRALVGKVRVTVHSRLPNGQTKSASVVFSSVELNGDTFTPEP